MLNTAEDFNVLPFALPNLLDENGDPIDGFTEFVEEQEEKALRELLGGVLYDAFIAGVPTIYVPEELSVVGQQYGYGNNVWEALIAVTTAPVAGVNWTLIESNNRWLVLRNGDDYTEELNGNTISRKWVGLKTLLKPLLYSLWVRFGSSRMSGIGNVVANAANSDVVSSNIKIIQGHNAYMRGVGYDQYTNNTFYQFLYLSGTLYEADVASEADDIQAYMNNNPCFPGFENEFDF